MYFLFVNKTYSQITKEPYGFKMQNFKILFSGVRKSKDKFLCLYDLTWDLCLYDLTCKLVKTSLQIAIGFFYSSLLTRRYIVSDKIMEVKSLAEYNRIPV